MGGEEIMSLFNSVPVYIAAFFLIINVLTFFAFALDKYLAKRALWRVSESALLTLAAFGGAVGATLAQRLLRHKTQKQPFKTILMFISVIQLLLIIWFGFAS
jgi:uncharacterized membrane protein YsdA (DUF1294 family)